MTLSFVHTTTAAQSPPVDWNSTGIAVPLRFDELSFYSTLSTFGTAVDITLAELAIEAFFPADVATSDYLLNATSPSISSRAG